MLIVGQVSTEEEQYELVTLPIDLQISTSDPIFKPTDEAAKRLMTPTLYLYSKKGYKKKKTLKARASRLNIPAICHIVNRMDEMFFDRFAPAEAERTKYRQPGFYELKPYGFEYRSLPFTPEVKEAIPEITKAAFMLLKEINE